MESSLNISLLSPLWLTGDQEGEEEEGDSDEPAHKRQFEAEFARLKESLEKEATRIIKPEL